MHIRFIVPLALVLVPLMVSADVIDDFSMPNFNNLGGIRSGQGVHVMLTYPRSGIAIPNEGDFLIENIFPYGFHHLNLTDKSLRIEYTAFSSGGRTIQYYQPMVNDQGERATPHEFNVPFPEGRHQTDIPLSSIVSSDVSKTHAFGIGGPLFVHRLEFVDTDESVAIPQASIECLGTGTEIYLRSYSLRRTETPPQLLSFFQYRTFVNLNQLGLRRDGAFIRRVWDAVVIEKGGFIYESLSTETDRIDLSDRQVRITYSAKHPAEVSIKLRYHPSSVRDGREVASTVVWPVQIGCMMVMDVPFSRFPGFRPLDAQSILISGLITVHSIKLVNEGYNMIPFTVSGGKFQNTIPVDDMSTWPDNVSEILNNMYLDHSDIGELADFSNSQAVGQNNLNRPCIGKGTILADGGIKLLDQGYIHEQLSTHEFNPETTNLNAQYWVERKGSRIFDLSYSVLEIEYSAEHQVLGQLNVLSLVPNDMSNDFRVEPVVFSVDYPKGSRCSIQINVEGCGPAIAFRITVQAEITFHQIRLHTSVSGQPGTPTILIIDDFTDWPLLKYHKPPRPNSIVTSVTPYIRNKNRGNSAEIFSHPVYNYCSEMGYNKPVLCNCVIHEWRGVEIMDGGYLSQQLPRNLGNYVKITYSATSAGTRRVVIVSNRRINSHEGHLSNKNMHVAFASGEMNAIEMSVDKDSLIAIQIHGPLVVHSIAFSSERWNVMYSPSDSIANALLIDAFDQWNQQGIGNILGGERFTNGEVDCDCVTLKGFSEYLVEGFEGEWNLDNLAFHFVYTTSETVTSKMMLISQLKRNRDWYGPYPPDRKFENVVFTRGNRKSMYVPAMSLVRALRDQPAPVYGFAIHGPNNGVLNLHQIGLSSWARGIYGEAMRPTTPSLRLSSSVRKQLNGFLMQKLAGAVGERA